MAADSDGRSTTTLKTVITCEGDLHHPEFSRRLRRTIDTLNGILGDVVKVRKLEPWNSVRVTLSIPREAALRLRQLASEGSPLLKTLGILSVQVEGDQVISLRIATGPLNSEPQEIVLQTTQDGPSTSSGITSNSGRPEFESPLSRLFGPSTSNSVPVVTNNSSTSEKVQFKSPNVVCPPDSVVPKVAISNSPTSSKSPFPFTSMNQAIHTREVVQPPPPPYPQPPPPVSMSSPLLVNLLQNDGVEPATTPSVPPPPPSPSVTVKCPRTVTNNNSVVVQTGSSNLTNSPSALIKHQTISTSISVAPSPTLPLNNNPPPQTRPCLPPPPPYPTSWPSPTHLPDLTPSLLTDLKADDLDSIIPSLEQDIVHSPPDLPEELINANSNLDGLDFETTSGKNFLINPLTGEMEPQSSGESETEDDVKDVFTGLPSPTEIFSDEDTSSTSRTDNALNSITDQSDSDTRSSLVDTSVKHRYKNSKNRDRGRDSPALKPTEKIKLRLKLEKSEPINPAYKVDVSFINMQQPKKASVVPPMPSSSTTNSEELRVPPLHISLRGRNHVVITNKKRSKISSDDDKLDKVKIRKNPEYALKKKLNDETSLLIDELVSNNVVNVPALNDSIPDQFKNRNLETKKVKKPKSNFELLNNTHLLTAQEGKPTLHNFHYKEKQKERRGSDSELARSNKKFLESNGVITSSEEKKRRLSQSECADEEEQLPGSTNVGTIIGLPKSARKEKVKNKELNRNKSYSKNLADKLAKHQVVLPTGEIDMEAKFKQRLLEGVNRPPHRTEQPPASEKPPPVEEKTTEPDMCNTPERKGETIVEKQGAARSPSNGAQGEDSGIESMDALSEKSPNQASQSPHADLPESALKSKSQVPDMMDIEAQLAKMEGLNGGDDCCGIQGNVVSISVKDRENNSLNPSYETDINLTSTERPQKDDLDPLPVRVAPPLYTYSNPEKSRDQEDVFDEEENDNPNHSVHKKSLLEQLLIEIPTDQQQPDSSSSPATRSVRTRASSKLNSPELNSPVTRQQRAPTPGAKRKRQESESSDETKNKKVRKTDILTPTVELLKTCLAVTEPILKVNNVKKAPSKGGDEDSSDSDEPLIEKMRKSNNTHSTAATPKAKVKTVTIQKPISAPLSTRRSNRTAIPAPNTRSKGDKLHSDAEAVRRKTRSAVLDVDSKRKKEVK